MHFAHSRCPPSGAPAPPKTAGCQTASAPPRLGCPAAAKGTELTHSSSECGNGGPVGSTCHVLATHACDPACPPATLTPAPAARCPVLIPSPEQEPSPRLKTPLPHHHHQTQDWPGFEPRFQLAAAVCPPPPPPPNPLSLIPPGGQHQQSEPCSSCLVGSLGENTW